jgi:hypothetical protein
MAGFFVDPVFPVIGRYAAQPRCGFDQFAGSELERAGLRPASPKGGAQGRAP